MEFLVKTTLGLEQIAAYQKAAGKTMEKGKTLLLRWGLMIFGGLSILGSVTAICKGFVDPGVIMGIVLGGFALIWGITWWKYQTRRIARQVPPNCEQEFYFNQDGIVANSGGERITHDYSAIYALAESEAYYFIFLDKRSGYVLQKSNFITGTAAEFGAFIQKRTGKKLPFVKI